MNLWFLSLLSLWAESEMSLSSAHQTMDMQPPEYQGVIFWLILAFVIAIGITYYYSPYRKASVDREDFEDFY